MVELVGIGRQAARAILKDARHHLLVGKAWNEAEHPRDNAGMWTDKDGGGSSGGNSKANKSSSTELEKLRRQESKLMDKSRAALDAQNKAGNLLFEAGEKYGKDSPQYAKLEKIHKKLIEKRKDADYAVFELGQKMDDAEEREKEEKKKKREEERAKNLEQVEKWNKARKEKDTNVTAKWTKGQDGDWLIQPDTPVKPGDKVTITKSDGSTQEHYVGELKGTVWGKDVYAVGKPPKTDDWGDDWEEPETYDQGEDYGDEWDAKRERARAYFIRRGIPIPAKYR